MPTEASLPALKDNYCIHTVIVCFRTKWNVFFFCSLLNVETFFEIPFFLLYLQLEINDNTKHMRTLFCRRWIRCRCCCCRRRWLLLHVYRCVQTLCTYVGVVATTRFTFNWIPTATVISFFLLPGTIQVEKMLRFRFSIVFTLHFVDIRFVSFVFFFLSFNLFSLVLSNYVDLFVRKKVHWIPLRLFVLLVELVVVFVLLCSTRCVKLFDSIFK